MHCSDSISGALAVEVVLQLHCQRASQCTVQYSSCGRAGASACRGVALTIEREAGRPHSYCEAVRMLSFLTAEPAVVQMASPAAALPSLRVLPHSHIVPASIHPHVSKDIYVNML